MKYPGGKGRIGRAVAGVILAERGARQTYIEPFIGAASVFEHVAPSFERAIGSDVLPDIVLMWQALASGWVPPSTVTEEEHAALKHAEPSALRAFVRFGCSFGGIFTAGFARNEQGTNYADVAARSLEKMRPVLSLPGVEVVHSDYRAWGGLMGQDVVVYADPPYAGTRNSYSSSQKRNQFDSEAFWFTVQQWAQAGALVFVSEESTPGWSGAVEVWSKTSKPAMAGSRKTDARSGRPRKVHVTERTERLFRVDPK